MSAILRERSAGDQRQVRLTPALDRIVRHCLEKNPSSRFQSRATSRSILQIASDEPGSSRLLARDLPAPKSQWRFAHSDCHRISDRRDRYRTHQAQKTRHPARPPYPVTQLTLQSGMERGVSLSRRQDVPVRERRGRKSRHLRPASRWAERDQSDKGVGCYGQSARVLARRRAHRFSLRARWWRHLHHGRHGRSPSIALRRSATTRPGHPTEVRSRSRQNPSTLRSAIRKLDSGALDR